MAQDEDYDDDLTEFESGNESASESEELDAEASIEPEAGDGEASVRVENADAYPEPSATRFRMARSHRPGAATYRLSQAQTWSPLKWPGGQIFGQVEVDVGYAAYEYPERQDRPEEALHDMRGRFVLGPYFQRDLGGGYQLGVLAQFVAWVREQEQFYQINVDDIYAQIGHGDDWDFQVGRFMTWRVYHKGLGFDIFTLEDQGANQNYPIANGDFAVHTYEVDYIFLRNSPYVGGEVAGRAAFHYYPSDLIGFELAAAYGLAQGRGQNTLGGRFAADFNWEFVRLSAAAEYRRQRQTGPPNTVFNPGTPEERNVVCDECGGSNNWGFGGGGIFTFGPVSAGGGFARGKDESFSNQADADGNPGPNPIGSGTRMSLGGYGEVNVGSLLLQRSLILGFGYNRTELILDNDNEQYHYQYAAYVAYPLGVNDAMAKLIFSQADAEIYNASGEGQYITFFPTSNAVRFRISSNF